MRPGAEPFIQGGVQFAHVCPEAAIMAGLVFVIRMVKLIVKIRLYTTHESFWSSSHPKITTSYSLVFMLWLFHRHSSCFMLFLQKWNHTVSPALPYRRCWTGSLGIACAEVQNLGPLPWPAGPYWNLIGTTCSRRFLCASKSPEKLRYILLHATF